MLIARENPDEILREVEWPTLFFFIGLFMLVAGVIEIGLVDAVADGIVALTGGELAPTSLLILWASAGLSAIVDNIPYTATMIPVVGQLSEGQPRRRNVVGAGDGCGPGGQRDAHRGERECDRRRNGGA